MSPDAFWKDSHVADPQSWNKYAYARNNPLRYVDPTGETATVTSSCSTSSDGKKSCAVSISAPIAIYAGSGSGISQDQLASAASTMQQSIQNAWTGSFSQDGVSYSVTGNISVSVAGSEADAKGSGAQNVFGMTNGPITLADGRVAGTYVNPRSSSSQHQDTGMMDIHGVDNYSKHEFTHDLGTGDKPGNVLSNTQPSMRPDRAQGADFGWGLREVTGQINGWQQLGQQAPYVAAPTYNPGATVGAPPPGQWWK
jgi:hypothetical protein